MRIISSILLCSAFCASALSSSADVLAKFIDKTDSLNNSAPGYTGLKPVDPLVPAPGQIGPQSSDDFATYDEYLLDVNFSQTLKEKTNTSAATASAAKVYNDIRTFSMTMFSFTAEIESNYQMTLDSVTFQYSSVLQWSRDVRSTRNGGGTDTSPTKPIPMSFSLYAKINGGERILITDTTYTIKGGYEDFILNPTSTFGKELGFDLSSASIQEKLAGASSIEFSIDATGTAPDGWIYPSPYGCDVLVFADQITLNGKVVPEPSSALLGMCGLLPLLLRKRRK